MYAVILTTGLLIISIGLLVSTFSQTADGALRTTYFLVFTLAFATILPWAFLQGKTSMIARLASHLRSVSPVTAIIQLLGLADPDSQGISSPTLGPWGFVLLAVVLSAVLMIVNIYIFSQRIFDLWAG